MLKLADFFCGAGGFSEGFRQKGFELVFALDKWKPAIETLKLYHPDSQFASLDIRDLDSVEQINSTVPDVDVIIGSPPCVSFSHSNIAGKADKSLGLQLINAFLRIVACKKKKGTLKYWIMENVPNTVKYIKNRYSWNELGLSGKGPSVRIPKKLVLNSADFGAPQKRNRMFAGDYPEPKKIHDTKNSLTVRHVLRSLGDPLGSNREGFVEDPNYPIKIKKSDLTDHFYDTRVEEWRWKQAKRLKEDHGFMGKMPFPDSLDRPSRAVLATRSASTREAMIFGAERASDGRYDTFRLPTIREIACFMSFPITYQFEGNSEESKYRLVGNAVTCKQAGALAEAILMREGVETSNPATFPLIQPTTDLTGHVREMKPPPRKRKNAKYARHVPYIKIRGFRVELTNKQSDFKNSKIVWSAILHKGTGKGAKRWEYGSDAVNELFDIFNLQLKLTSQNDLTSRIKEFKTETVETFKARLPDAKTFQNIFTRRAKVKQIGPDEALATVRKLVDKYYPEEEYGSATIKNNHGCATEPEYFPIRIIAGLFACKYIVDSVNRY